MPSYVFAVIAPEGTLSARFELESGKHSRPTDITVERGALPTAEPNILTVTATRLPAEADFRVLAASAANKRANEPQDPAGRLLSWLIPF